MEKVRVDRDPWRALGGSHSAGSGLSGGRAGSMSGSEEKSMSARSSNVPPVENSLICKTICSHSKCVLVSNSRHDAIAQLSTAATLCTDGRQSGHRNALAVDGLLGNKLPLSCSPRLALSAVGRLLGSWV